MPSELAVGAMDGLALLAGQLDLAARFDGYRGAFAAQRDKPSVLVIGFVTITFDEPAHDLFHAARAGKRQRTAVAGRDRDLLVLAAHAPFGTRLRPVLEIAHQMLF